MKRLKISWNWLKVPMVCAILFSAGRIPSGVLCAATEVARAVKYSRQDIVPIKAKIRFSTLIALPEGEEILDFTTGDKEFWIINGVHNLCHVHPAKAGIRSNLNLITASGHVYSFLLTEVSNESNTDPDLKVFVEPKEESSLAGLTSPRRYVLAAEAETYKKELETVRAQAAEQAQAAQTRASESVNKYRAEYPAKMRFDYRYSPKAAGKPFMISAIYHDDTFTYIKCAAQEKPTIYEVKDRKPSLVNFDFQNGVYLIPNIIDQGYLAVGKRKLSFTRKG